MNIRTATIDDLPQIVEIYNQAVVQHGATADLAPVTVASRQQWFVDHPPDTYPIWVADDNGSVLGWCSLSAYRPGRMALRRTAEISYYVHEGHRRRGIGSRLVRHAISQCAGLGLDNLFALLLDVNTSSVRILEQSGFARWGHMPDVAEIDGTVCGHLIYGRPVREHTGASDGLVPG